MTPVDAERLLELDTSAEKKRLKSIAPVSCINAFACSSSLAPSAFSSSSDDDLTTINGRRDQLEGALQRRYGYAKHQARQDVDTWFSTLH
jgi:hypothetical protein